VEERGVKGSRNGRKGEKRKVKKEIKRGGKG
jgi:hypothetical protein